jgi:hypothetical protein
MDAEARAGRHLAIRSPDEGIHTGGVAIRTRQSQLRRHLRCRPDQGAAEFVAGPRPATFVRHGLSDTDRHPAFAQYTTDGAGLTDNAAGRVEKGRQVATAQRVQELTQATLGIAVDPPVGCDPLAAAGAAGVGGSFGHEEDDRHPLRDRRNSERHEGAAMSGTRNVMLLEPTMSGHRPRSRIPNKGYRPDDKNAPDTSPAASTGVIRAVAYHMRVCVGNAAASSATAPTM